MDQDLTTTLLLPSHLQKKEALVPPQSRGVELRCCGRVENRGRVRPASAGGGRNAPRPGCLGRRSGPGRWLSPDLSPARPPRPLFPPSQNRSSAFLPCLRQCLPAPHGSTEMRPRHGRSGVEGRLRAPVPLHPPWRAPFGPSTIPRVPHLQPGPRAFRTDTQFGCPRTRALPSARTRVKDSERAYGETAAAHQVVPYTSTRWLKPASRNLQA